jgi:F1F0 ATPase subunit 2
MDAQAMTTLGPTEQLSSVLVSACAWLAIGVATGTLYTLTLRWNVRAFLMERSLWLACGAQLLRFMLIAVALASIAKSHGALPLLATTLGMQLARTAIARSGLPA